MSRLQKISLAVIAVLVVILGLMDWRQSTHFNKNVTINGVRVGGLTANQAYQKLKNSKLSGRVYLNGHEIYEGQAEKVSFSSQDQAKFKVALKKQKTFFPSNKRQALTVVPSHKNQDRIDRLHARVMAKLAVINESRTKPVDSQVSWANNKVTVTKPRKGNYYDLHKMSQYLDQHAYDATIKLPNLYEQPLNAGSAKIKQQQKKLQALNHRKVSYRVENKTYTFTTNQVISKATYDGSYHLNTHKFDAKVKQINQKQATLGQSWTFRTHEGKLIHTAKGGSYGWKINAKKAGHSVGMALINNQKSLNAKDDLEGGGYTAPHGLGYGVTANHGLGNTYVEVSIPAQHAWFYKDGKEVYSANIVTGKESTNEGTHKGVWYILYQQRNATLRGSSAGGHTYTQPVKYWSPFTADGQGFHDAPWRTNWSSSAYLNDGSGGCCNMEPGAAGVAFEAMQTHEPVIIY